VMVVLCGGRFGRREDRESHADGYAAGQRSHPCTSVVRRCGLYGRPSRDAITG
jgi:hypothetical protein